MTPLICHSRRQAGIQSGVAAGTRSYISDKQQAPSPCRHSRIERRGIKAKEFGYAERFNNWIARNKPGNDDSLIRHSRRRRESS
ncbi:hypothetical protein [Candidatus Spongiihabitans sp.]|uniref:hypothetical protein n=1 Tax=Candidatus Spongiihabitans sp. TaxID=3101308 RepID=UPI003C7CCD42